MAIENISQLTPEMQAAVPGAPGVPAPVLPIANAISDQQASPDQGQPQPAGPAAPIGAPPVPATTSSPTVNAIHKGINDAAANTPPEQAGKPGQWARQILSGLNSAFSNVETGLVDFDAAKVPEGNHGLLGGIAAVQAAKASRQQAAQVAQTKEDMDRAQIAKINVDTHYQQILLHSLQGAASDRANEAAIANGKVALDLATTGSAEYGIEPGKIIQKDITEGQLQQALQDKTWDPIKETFSETGKIPAMENGKVKLDEDGMPVWQKQYTIYSIPPEVVLSQKAADFINQNLGTKLPEGTRISGPVALAQMQQASNQHALLEKQKSERENAELADATNEQKLQQVRAGKSLGPDFFHIAAQSDLDLDKTMAFITGQHMTPGIDPKTGKPGMVVDPRSADFAAKHPTAGQDLISYMGGLADYTKIRDSQVAEAEKERHDQAEENARIKAEQDKKTADLNDQTDAFGNKSPLSDKEFNKRYDAFTGSAQNKTVQTLAGSYQQFNSILNDVNAGKMTPAESVVGLLNAVGISATPLAGKGFRINSNILDEHVGAQQGGPGAAKLRQLSTGDILSSQQLQDYARIAADVYKQSYLNAANEQRRTLGYVDILPRGNNQQIDPMTASMYLQIAGNNPQLAAQAAQKQGWQVTPQSFGGGKAATGKSVSLSAAMGLPINKGKTEAQVRADIVSHGHEVGQ